MKELLDLLVPRLIPGLVESEHFQCVPHQGKTDLERSIPRKLRGWREPGVRFVVVEDNDNRTCTEVKARLKAMAADASRPDTLVRIVCQELESWYLGDLKAMANAFCHEDLNSETYKKRYFSPDALQKPSAEVERLLPNFQKRSGARLMGKNLGVNTNSSPSFNAFVKGLSRITAEMGYTPV